MSQYSIIYSEDAIRYLNLRGTEDEISLDDITRVAGSGDPVPSKPIEELSKQLRALKKRFPAKLKEKTGEGGRFERDACVIVHQCLSTFDKVALSDRHFWTWLSVAKLADIVEWRFGSDGRPAKSANYGTSTRIENMFFRLWLRAELGKGSGKDPYELAKIGDQDLWRSHVLRQSYTNARAVAKSLLKLQAGKLLIQGKRAKKLAGGTDKNGIRMLAKRLRRLRANVMFEFLTAPQADALVFELSADLKKGT